MVVPAAAEAAAEVLGEVPVVDLAVAVPAALTEAAFMAQWAEAFTDRIWGAGAEGPAVGAGTGVPVLAAALVG